MASAAPTSGVHNAEARKTPRVPFSANVQVHAEGGEQLKVARAHNLSLGGMFLGMEGPLSVGQSLLLTVVLLDGPFLEARGRVAWRRVGADAHGPAGMGIAFTDLTGGTLERIRSLVERERKAQAPES